MTVKYGFARLLPFLVFVMTLMLLDCCTTISPADLIIRGGRIYTMDPGNPKVEAVAIRGERIVYAGMESGVARFKDSKTRIIDLDGNVAYPGLVDAHAHLMGLGRLLSELNFVGTTSAEEIRRMVLEKQTEVPEGKWVSGRGWDQNDWTVKRFPSWRDLSGTEANPVCLRRVDGHAIWVNRTALDICGVTSETADPIGGRIVRDDENGEPTGVFVDEARELIWDHMPKSTREEKRAWAIAAMRECNSYGLVGIHDASTDSVDLEIYKSLHEAGKLSLRIYTMLSADSIDFVKRRMAAGRGKIAGGYVTVRALKLFADGALGSRGAALLEPYSDDTGNTGLLVNTPEYLYEMTKLALDHGFQVCTHAIGDAANRIVLNAYEKALDEHRLEDHRFRIEHAQVVSLDDIPRFAELCVIPSMQPTHATSDMYWAEDRVGPERIRGAYAWRKFMGLGCQIPCGSDFPVESANPLWGVYAAVTRQDHEGWPEGGWYPDECMTIEEALKGFTIHAAFAAFAEKETGSIEVGKLADITILDRDLQSIPHREILNTRAVYTIVGGKVVYSAVSP